MFHSKLDNFDGLNLELSVQVSCSLLLTFCVLNCAAPMAGKYIVAGLVGSCVISYACDYIVSQKKIFGGMLCVLPL